MGDIGKRSAVHERRVVLQGLHEVWLKCIAEQRCHRALGVEFLYGDGVTFARVADHDIADSLLEIIQIRCKTENRHNLRCPGDVKTRLPRDAVAWTAKTAGDVAQGPVVHVNDPPPRDTSRVEV